MTFKLYRVTNKTRSYYDYSINDLAGAQDDMFLSTLVDNICTADSLILPDCINFTDMYATDSYYEGYTVTYPALIILNYREVKDLRENLRTDLKQQFPEEFV